MPSVVDSSEFCDVERPRRGQRVLLCFKSGLGRRARRELVDLEIAAKFGWLSEKPTVQDGYIFIQPTSYDRFCLHRLFDGTSDETNRTQFKLQL